MTNCEKEENKKKQEAEEILLEMKADFAEIKPFLKDKKMKSTLMKYK